MEQDEQVLLYFLNVHFNLLPHYSLFKACLLSLYASFSLELQKAKKPEIWINLDFISCLLNSVREERKLPDTVLIKYKCSLVLLLHSSSLLNNRHEKINKSHPECPIEVFCFHDYLFKLHLLTNDDKVKMLIKQKKRLEQNTKGETETIHLES